MKQSTNHLLMIEPVAFRFNQETAENNYYQEKSEESNDTIQEKAHLEFTGFVEKLRANGIDVTTIQDIKEQETPDSIFPNNWISFHNDGTVILYPMFAENRRKERRGDILETLQKKFRIDNVIDISGSEKDDLFLEGTGSIILDRENKIAYAALSVRTDLDLFLKYCEDFGFEPVHFTAYQTVNGDRLPIYHTNVMMEIGTNIAVVCLDCIDDLEERTHLKGTIERSGKKIIEITEEQVENFAGNMLELTGKNGECFQVMSSAAFYSLNPEQVAAIEEYCTIIHSDLSTIESNGGGSARCMMAEVFLPLR